MLKKIFSLFFLLLLISKLSLITIGCQNINNIQNPNLISLINKLNKEKTIIIKSYNEDLNLENLNLINDIENNLQLTNLETDNIISIKFNTDKLVENKMLSIAFDLNNNQIINNKIIFYSNDISNLKNDQIYQIEAIDNGENYLATTSNGLYISKNLVNFIKINFSDDINVSVYSFTYYDSLLFIATSKGIYYSFDDLKSFSKLNFDNTIYLNNHKINSILLDGSDAYIATNQGLYTYGINDSKHFAVKKINGKINKILIAQKIYALTNNGLYISYDKTNFQKIDNNSFYGNTNENVIVNNISVVFIYNSPYLLLSTNNGLYIDNLIKHNYASFYLNNNLDHINVLCTKIIKSVLYIGTDKGLYQSYDYFNNFVSNDKLKNISINSINIFPNVYNTAYILTNSYLVDLNNEKEGFIYFNIS